MPSFLITGMSYAFNKHITLTAAACKNDFLRRRADQIRNLLT